MQNFGLKFSSENILVFDDDIILEENFLEELNSALKITR